MSLATGDELWRNANVDITRKALILKDGALVAYPNPTEDEPVDSDTGVAVYSATDGTVLWEEKETPLIADERRGHLNRYTFVVGDTLYLPDARELRTGKKILKRQSPLTGVTSAFDLCGKNFCGSVAASREMLAFRSASVGFQEIEKDSGAFWFPEIRPSCWISVVPAGGLVLAPEGYSTCICPYNYKTSLALVPVERYEDWSIYLTGRADKRKKSKQKKQPIAEEISQLRVNFNAPGDHMDSDGNLWFAYPRPTGKDRRYLDTQLPITVDGVTRSFRYNSDSHPIDNTESPWLMTSGVEGPVKVSVQLPDTGPRSYDVQMSFAETEDVSPGNRVFDIVVEGKKMVSGFDIARASGGKNCATTLQFMGVAARGGMSIELVPVSGKRPRICSLVIKETEER